MSTGTSTISLHLPYDKVFSMLGASLENQIGASALLYAVISYIVFDEAFYLEDIIEHHPDLYEDITWWQDDIYSTYYTLFQNLRTFYETAVSSDSECEIRKDPFRLLRVTYDSHGENIFVTASRDKSDNYLGSIWQLSKQCV